jgi:DHA1 family bicyclomycin/chloramphenicol resistance-like MFS transporter
MFGIAFALCSVFFVLGTLMGTRMVSRRGFDRTISAGVALLAVGGVGQWLGAFFLPGEIVALVIPEMIYFTGIGLVLPQSLAAAMAPFPERAGAASSLAGFVQMICASAAGAAVGAIFGDSAMPLVTASALSGIGALLIFRSTKRVRRKQI